MNVEGAVVLLLLACAVLALLLRRALRRRGSFIDPESPIWQEAARKARSTLPLLRQLHASSGEPVVVKYALENERGEIELVWGELLGMSASTFTASLETPLVGGDPASPPPYELPFTSLQDWQVALPDGNIRGGFTTQAELALLRQVGQKPPPHIAEMEGRFVDR